MIIAHHTVLRNSEIVTPRVVSLAQQSIVLACAYQQNMLRYSRVADIALQKRPQVTTFTFVPSILC